MQALTDEERKRLIERLRRNGFDMDAEIEAADEIERLEERLALAHGYADMCEEKIRFLSDQIDEMLAAARASSGRFDAGAN